MATVMALVAPLVLGIGPAEAVEVQSKSEAVAGFSGKLDSDFNNFGARVWALERIGDRIYVGGKFTSTVSGPGGTTINRVALVALDANTGKLVASFNPDIRGGGVYGLLASPDGSRLFVTGEFTSVGGAAQTAGLAALNPTTGQLDPTWRAGLERPWTAARANGRTLAISGNHLYVGGSFSHIVSGPISEQLARVARVNIATGAPDAAWDPNIQGGGVWDIEISPGGDRVYLGGYFTSVNQQSVPGFAAIHSTNRNMVDGLAPLAQNEPGARIHAVEAIGDRVFVGGEQHFLQVLRASDLNRTDVYFTGSLTPSSTLVGGGDFQTLTEANGIVYAGCHCWISLFDPADNTSVFEPYQARVRHGTWNDVSSIAAFSSTGKYLPNFRPAASGAAGSWAIEVDHRGCVWSGGGYTQSEGQWLSDLAKWCPPQAQVTDPVVVRPDATYGLMSPTNEVGNAQPGITERGTATGQRG